MTTVVYFKGQLAGDTQVTAGNVIDGSIRKVFKLSDSLFVGFSGSAEHQRPFIDWVVATYSSEGGPSSVKPPTLRATKDNNFEAIVIQKHQNKTFVHTYTASFTPISVVNPPIVAIGSGSQIVLGAYELSLSARIDVEAKDLVRIAAKRDIYTGGNIQTIEV